MTLKTNQKYAVICESDSAFLSASILGDAIIEAEKWTRDGWLDDDETSTIWLDYEIYILSADHECYAGTDDPVISADTIGYVCDGQVTIDPTGPLCPADITGHNWTSTVEREGGIKENPGVWGHGGGVIIEEHCTRCDATMTTDTWAQDGSTGQQGLISISYGVRDDDDDDDLVSAECEKYGRANIEA